MAFMCRIEGATENTADALSFSGSGCGDEALSEGTVLQSGFQACPILAEAAFFEHIFPAIDEEDRHRDLGARTPIFDKSRKLVDVA